MSSRFYREIKNLPPILPPPRIKEAKWGDLLRMDPEFLKLLGTTISPSRLVKDYLRSNATHIVSLFETPGEEKNAPLLKLKAGTTRAASLLKELAAIAEEKNETRERLAVSKIDSIYKEEAYILYHRECLKIAIPHYFPQIRITPGADDEKCLYGLADAITQKRKTEKQQYKSAMFIAFIAGGAGIFISLVGFIFPGLGSSGSPTTPQSAPNKGLVTGGSIVLTLSILIPLWIAYKYAKLPSMQDPITEKDCQGYEEHLANYRSTVQLLT